MTGYIDLFVDLPLALRLRLFHANTSKRLVKSPKVRHPVVGASWEGFSAEFYQTSAGSEIDSLLELSGRHGLWASRSNAPPSRILIAAFHNAREDIKPKRSFVVYAGNEGYPLGSGLEGIRLR